MAKKTSPFLLWGSILLAYIGLLFFSLFFWEEEPVLESFTVFTESDQPIIVLLHDPVLTEPGFSEQLGRDFQTIEVAYDPISFEKMATNISQQLEERNLSNIHIVAEGIGGSIAFHLTEKDQDRFSSLTLISANGIEELELLGGYFLNHAIYNIRTMFFIAVKYGVPHFGSFDEIDDRILRSKIQYESDQRLIRPMMAEIDLPVHILHGENAKISREVSVEHRRLLPQSELVDVVDSKESLSEISEFIFKVENGDAAIRGEVSEYAQEQSLLPFDPANSVKAEGVGLLILMLIIILSTLISEDLTCIGTGLMIARGLIGFAPGVIACLFGIFMGDILLYLAGRWLGANTLNRAPLRWFITEKDIELSYHWFEAKGPTIIIASRFIPGSRFPTYFSAGAIGANFLTFITYFGIASIIWTPILVGLAVLLGQEMINYFSIYQDYALWVLLGVLGLLFILFKILIPALTYKGRRLIVGKWKRFTNWEFWSPYLIYFPVLLYTSFLWMKYKSITLVTLANPGIKDGGFIGESKHSILSSIEEKKSVARFHFIDAELSSDEKVDSAKLFIQTQELDYPIVVKPDVGERGKGVNIVQNEEELVRTLSKSNEDLIVQEYISGIEFGVFYYRYPKEENGAILSVTQKKYMTLEGDGKHTLEHLILKDSRAVCLAEIHFKQHVDSIYLVPEKGEIINLVNIGTHARGSIFLDAEHLITDELKTEMDKISKSIPGFYFGRFDIKVPSDEDFKKGENLKVLEVNGVTSEATHIYDPKYSYLFAVKTLMNQWKVAYQIAAQVKEQQPNLKPPGPRHIISLLN